MVSKTKVLFLSYDGLTDPLPQSQVLPYVFALSKFEFSFTVISFEKPIAFQKNKDYIQGICDENQVRWLPLTYTKKPPILGTIWDIIRLGRLCDRLIREEGYTVLHSRSYVPAIVGRWMQQRHKSKFIFDMRGFWADERIDGKIWSLKNPIHKWVYQFFKQKEKEFLLHADHTISLTFAGKAEIEKFDFIVAHPIEIEVIPCCVDTVFFSRLQIKEPDVHKLKSELGISADAFVLGYVGSIGTWYMLPEMLDFFKALLAARPDAIFLFLTQESKASIVDMAIEKQIPESSIRITSVARNDMPIYISLMDFSIFFIKPSFSKIASSPTKQGEIMSLGIPIICNSGVGDTDYVVNKYAAGEVVSQFNEMEYSLVITKILSKSYANETIMKGANEFYSLVSGSANFLKIYRKILE